jgi:hypothetical protein
VTAIGGAGLTGCEPAKGLHGLTVEPSHAVLKPGSNVVDFTVSSQTNAGALALPLEWSVSDPSLGNILYKSGWTARYEGGSANGENTVAVRDQYDNEGYATVKQMSEQYSVTLTATPNPIPAGTNICTIVATGGVAPYQWSVRNSSLGRMISGGTSDHAVYRSEVPGDNVVHVRDANGVLGTVVVTQQGGSGGGGGLPPGG